MAALHSLLDGLEIKIRCHQKEGDTLRPQHLIPWFTLKVGGQLAPTTRIT